jgi:general stress protein YciG
MNRCKGRTKAGQPCGAAATAGGLCFFHANPNKASELGRKGGRRNRHFSAESAAPLPKMSTATAVRDAVAQLIDDVHTGKLDPRIAAGLAPLIHLQLRAIEIADLEGQVARWQKQLAEVAAGAHPLPAVHQESQMAEPDNSLPEPEIDGQEPASAQGSETWTTR